MTQLLKAIFFLVISSTLSSTFAGNTAKETDEQVLHQCPDYVEAQKQLDDWMIPALASPNGLGCPQKSVELTLAKLEKIGLENNNELCKDHAIATVLEFYILFTEHPNYVGCGLYKKQLIFLSRTAPEKTICADKETDEIKECFSEISIYMSTLKSYGELDAAFELATKMANSNDVTGLSQMMLGVMYMYGQGTSVDIDLSIECLKEALERMDDEDMRIDITLFLAHAYDKKQDYKNAKKYIQQCAILGDLDCKRQLNELAENLKKRNININSL